MMAKKMNFEKGTPKKTFKKLQIKLKVVEDEHFIAKVDKNETVNYGKVVIGRFEPGFLLSKPGVFDNTK